MQIFTRMTKSWSESLSISGVCCSAMRLSWRYFVKRWKHRPSCTRPARPRRCFALALDMNDCVKRDSCLRSSNLISLCLPVSMTQVMSGIVTPVSAMFVASTILRTPGGGTRNAACWSSLEMVECSGYTYQSALNEGWLTNMSLRIIRDCFNQTSDQIVINGVLVIRGEHTTCGRTVTW